MNRLSANIGLVLLALLLTSCSTHGEVASHDGSATASSPTRVPRHVDKSNRPQVTFDPCLDLPDAALVEAGYNPASEENADFTPEEYTFLGCSYDTPQRLYGLNVLSGNISFAEESQKAKEYAAPIDINGRPALLKWERGLPDACAVSVETAYGVLIIDRSVFKGTGMPAPEAEWCAGLEDTARIFERYIPKEG
ncbi:DUF3558 domain-containing protein [Rhodococcus sp. MSC1_016]|jgi:hypothetical protein|uniref:DUF3558 domain-containing protein n=1 Tax=Rhodococcus sp. MSC1_016 TaxID=2909266 RepID=UPI0025467CC3|nr:DUF3558 domain-containing protein [Rhodococcus sp. MSC1_016]